MPPYTPFSRSLSVTFKQITVSVQV